MADVTINQLTSQAPTTSDIFPFATTGVTPSTYKATLAQIKTALAIPAALGFTPVQQGGGTGQGTNKLYMGWSGSGLLLQVDVTNFANTWPISVSGTASNGAKAWVNFNGQTGTQVGTEFHCTIRSQYNVSSVVRVRNGVYRINFTTAMNNANYMTQYTGGYEPTQDTRVFHTINSDVPPTAANVTVASTRQNGSQFDTDLGNVLVFGT